MNMTFTPQASRPARGGQGFSLVEVVIAIAVFAATAVAVLGLMAPLQRNVDSVLDSRVASRLARTIQQELQSIGIDRILEFLDTEDARIRLAATPDGGRVRMLTTNDPADTADADRPLNDIVLPGIADRDRYFLITMGWQFPYSETASGALNLYAKIEWPYQLPTGPATDGAVAHDQDLAQDVSDTQRQSMRYHFSLTP